MTRLTRSAASVLALALLLLDSTAQAAPIIYGSAYPPAGSASLYNIDPATGAATLIGAIGFNRVSGIDFNPLTGILYGTGQRPSGGPIVLLTINPLTGAGVEIGSTTLRQNITDISFRSDGTLFAYSAGEIYTINTLTGAATDVGNTGSPSSSGGGNSLAFSSADTLYKVDNNFVFTVNQTTGAATTGPAMDYTPLADGPRANGMDFDPATGTLWASVNTGFEASAPFYLTTIDVSTSVATVIGETQIGMDALAVAPQAEVVPEPSTFVLAALGLVGWGFVARRKKYRRV